MEQIGLCGHYIMTKIKIAVYETIVSYKERSKNEIIANIHTIKYLMKKNKTDEFKFIEENNIHLDYIVLDDVETMTRTFSLVVEFNSLLLTEWLLNFG